MTLGPGLYAHISQWATRGVDVIGCHFENVRTANGDPIGRGHGITSIDATYTVREHCASLPPFGQPCPQQDLTPGTFTGLQHGIDAAAGSANSSIVSVSYCGFTDNHRGIVLSNAELSKVTDNTFSPGLFGPMPVGLYIDGTSSYTVECNEFNDAGTAPLAHDDHRYGITSLNCGVASPISKNIFKNLYVGAQALGSNRNSAGVGLQYLSNGFDGNFAGVVVLQSGSLPHQGIAVGQGTTSAPAGNYFNAQSSLMDFYNASQGVIYFHHAGTGPWVPTCFSNTTFLWATSVSWSLWSCGAVMKSMAMFGEDTEQQQEKEAELAQMLDAGATMQLQTQVETTDNNADMQVYGTLMQTSPNLSEEVLLTAVERPAPLPNAMLRDVLVANPQAGKSQEVMDGLADRPQQLPEYMVWQVEQGGQSVSPIERLRADIAMLATERRQTANALVRHWLFPEDGEPLQHDSAIALLTAKDDAHAHHLLALLHTEAGDATAAAHHALLMGERTDGPGEDEAQRLAGLLSVLADMNAENRAYGQLTEAELAQLEELAIYEGGAGNRARSILRHLGGETVMLPVLPVPQMPQHRKAIPSMDGMSAINVFPNPGRDHVTIDYSFEELGVDNLFEVMDMQGRTLLTARLVGQRDQQVVDIRALAAGSYVYRVSQDGRTLSGGTFIVAGH